MSLYGLWANVCCWERFKFSDCLLFYLPNYVGVFVRRKKDRSTCLRSFAPTWTPPCDTHNYLLVEYLIYPFIKVTQGDKPKIVMLTPRLFTIYIFVFLFLHVINELTLCWNFAFLSYIFIFFILPIILYRFLFGDDA